MRLASLAVGLLSGLSLTASVLNCSDPDEAPPDPLLRVVMGVGPACASQVSGVSLLAEGGGRASYRHSYTAKSASDWPITASVSIPREGGSRSLETSFTVRDGATSHQVPLRVTVPPGSSGRIAMSLACVCLSAPCPEGKNCLESPPGSGKAACIDPVTYDGETSPFPELGGGNAGQGGGAGQAGASQAGASQGGGAGQGQSGQGNAGQGGGGQAGQGQSGGGQAGATDCGTPECDVSKGCKGCSDCGGCTSQFPPGDGYDAACVGADGTDDPGSGSSGVCGDQPWAFTRASVNVGYYPFRTKAGASVDLVSCPGTVLETLQPGAAFAVQSTRNPGCTSNPPLRPARAGYVFGYAVGSSTSGWIRMDALEFKGYEDDSCVDGPFGQDFQVSANPYDGCKPTACTGTQSCAAANSPTDGADDCGGNNVSDDVRTVKAKDLIVRYAPGSSSTPIRFLHKGDHVHTRYDNGKGWIFVQVSVSTCPDLTPVDSVGWVSSDPVWYE